LKGCASAKSGSPTAHHRLRRLPGAQTGGLNGFRRFRPEKRLQYLAFPVSPCTVESSGRGLERTEDGCLYPSGLRGRGSDSELPTIRSRGKRDWTSRGKIVDNQSFRGMQEYGLLLRFGVTRKAPAPTGQLFVSRKASEQKLFAANLKNMGS